MAITLDDVITFYGSAGAEFPRRGDCQSENMLIHEVREDFEGIKPKDEIGLDNLNDKKLLVFGRDNYITITITEVLKFDKESSNN